jgi:mono/diheme cytochrome c family protein
MEAGKSYRLEYTVRQHGRDLLTGLQGSVEVQGAGGTRTSVQSAPASKKGSYAATFTVPDADQMNLKITSGFSGGGWGDLTVTGIPIARAGKERPTLTLAQRGRRLFVAKGCGTCHTNNDIPEFAQSNRVLDKLGPELTGRRLEAAYVRQRLTNPSSLPPIGADAVRMPNLELASGEVDALVAMLSGPVQRAGL